MEKPIIDRTPIVDKIYADIRSRIIYAELLPDTKLGVRELSEYYGVSDTPIKQALNRLVSDGLVDAVAHCGMRVRRITKEDIKQACEARFMIESFAIQYALRVADKTDLCKRLRNILIENERLVKEVRCGKANELEELRVSQLFHKMIVDCTENKLITDTYEKTLNCQYIYYQQNVSKTDELEKSLDEHRAILSALEAGDASALESAIRSHLQARECAALFAIEKN